MTWRRRAQRVWQHINVRGVRVAVGALLSALFLWLAFRQVPAGEVVTSLSSVRPIYVSLALVLVILSPLVRAIRWRLLYHPHHEGLRLDHLTIILLISQMLNIVLPARGGEVARVLFTSRSGELDAPRTVGTIVIEKWLDLVVLFVLTLLVPLAVTLPPWFRDPRIALGVFVIAFLCTALVITYGRRRLMTLASSLARFFPARWRRPVRDGLASTLEVLQVLRSPWVGLQLQAWSLLTGILSILVNYAVMLALDIELPLAAAAFVLVVLQVGVAVPSTPGKLGIFHYLCVLSLSVFGVGSTAALSYGVLLYFVVFVPPILLGSLGFWWMTVRNSNHG
jgi:uncharacterized protein (TIRG00374 family)